MNVISVKKGMCEDEILNKITDSCVSYNRVKNANRLHRMVFAIVVATTGTRISDCFREIVIITEKLNIMSIAN